MSTEAPPVALTKVDFVAELARVGVQFDRVEKIRLTMERSAQDDAMILAEVTTYALNEKGLRYFDAETREIAKEVRLFPVGTLHLFAP